MSVSLVLRHAAETIGEGPVWDSQSKSLYFVDAFVGAVKRWNTETNQVDSINLGPETASFIIPVASGGFLVSRDQAVHHLDWDSKKETPVAKVNRGRLNDAKCDSAGRLWMGSLRWKAADAEGEPELGAMYSLEKGEVKQHPGNFIISNGIAWNKQYTKMYYTDTLAGKIYAYDYDLTAGTVENQTVAVDFTALGEAYGLPDGCAMDAEDHLWVACPGAGKVIQFDLTTGTSMQSFKLPVLGVLSVCFGGEDLSDLYVVTGTLDHIPDPNTHDANSIFKITGLGVKGMPVASYVS